MTIREVLSDGPAYRLRALRSILSHRTLDDKRAGYCIANIDGRMKVRRGSVRKESGSWPSPVGIFRKIASDRVRNDRPEGNRGVRPWPLDIREFESTGSL